MLAAIAPFPLVAIAVAVIVGSLTVRLIIGELSLVAIAATGVKINALAIFAAITPLPIITVATAIVLRDLTVDHAVAPFPFILLAPPGIHISPSTMHFGVAEIS